MCFTTVKVYIMMILLQMLQVIVMMLKLMLPLMMTLRASGKQNYCSISKQHTLCQAKGLGQSCGVAATSRGVGQQEILQIVASHNG